MDNDERELMRMSRVVRRFRAAAVVLYFLMHFVLVPWSLAQPLEPLKARVVRVVSTSLEGMRQVGTGFVVALEADLAYIVTASHVVEGAREVQVEFYHRRNRLVPAKVIGMEAGDPKGLAALSVGGGIPEDLSGLALDSSMPVRGGERVKTIGFPRISGVSWAVISGDIVGRKGSAITFSGAVDEGNSGGPLIKEGRVIGIVTEVAGKFAYATPAIIAQYSLEGWGIGLKPQIAEPPIPDEAQPEPAVAAAVASEEGTRILEDGSILAEETGLVWMVIPELMTWSEAKKRYYEVKKAGELKKFEWHIPTRGEVERLISAIDREKTGPLSNLQGTFWIDEEKHRDVSLQRTGKLGLFVTYVDIGEGKFLESNEGQRPRANKLLLARPDTGHSSTD
jgi:hypothetical protein